MKKCAVPYLRGVLIMAGGLFMCLCARATPPVITGPPNGATSAAFWYLGGITPSCCSDITNKYWTVWAVNLTLNNPAPNPTIVWSTDSPTLGACPRIPQDRGTKRNGTGT